MGDVKLGHSVQMNSIRTDRSLIGASNDLASTTNRSNFGGEGARVRHRQRPQVRDSIQSGRMVKEKTENPNLEAVHGFNSLPLVHNHDDVLKTKDPQCALCYSKFRSIKKMFGASHHNC